VTKPFVSRVHFVVIFSCSGRIIAFAVLGFVSSVKIIISQETDWKERLRNTPILCRLGRKNLKVKVKV